MMKKIILKEGEVGIFTADGEFIIRVDNGVAHIIPGACFIHMNDTANYKHDCDKCVFLGVFHGDERVYDGYFCNQNSISTVIARFGDEGSQYLSGLGFDHVLREIETLARHIGLL